MTATLSCGQLETAIYTNPEIEDSLSVVSSIVGSLGTFGCIFNISVTVLLGKSKAILGKMVILLAIFDILSHLPLVFVSLGATTPVSCEIIVNFVSFSLRILKLCFLHVLFRSFFISESETWQC